MQGNLSHFAHARSNSVSLGGSHGYRFEGDTAILNAELAFAPVADKGLDHTRQHWALQLWACEDPHQGGPLRGLKVAEAELALPSLVTDGQGEATRLETAAFAQLPPRHGEYAMVMVLASGDQGRYDQVHDFSNYAVRQQFSGPSLAGNVGYRFEDDSVVLQAEALRNARAADNLSGTLGLQLWALHEPYQGGNVHGTLLAHASLGRLSGQQEVRSIEQRVPLAELAAGVWHLALLLREWTDAAGFITRDYCNFTAPHHVDAAPRAAELAPDLKALSVVAAPRPVAATARSEQVSAEEPLTTQAPRVDNASEVAPEARLSAAAAPAPRKARISVQTASVDELASVDGLNKKLAQAIIKARPFGTLDDVLRVRGIGDKLLQKLRDKLTL